MPLETSEMWTEERLLRLWSWLKDIDPLLRHNPEFALFQQAYRRYPEVARRWHDMIDERKARLALTC